MPYEQKARSKEIKEYRRRCWCPDCKKTAWFKDWAGWCWCYKHLLRNLRQSEHLWTEIKYLKIRWPY